jgi:hypothetical protein
VVGGDFDFEGNNSNHLPSGSSNFGLGFCVEKEATIGLSPDSEEFVVILIQVTFPYPYESSLHYKHKRRKHRSPKRV